MDAKKANQEAYKLTYVEAADAEIKQTPAGDNTQGGTGTNP